MPQSQKQNIVGLLSKKSRNNANEDDRESITAREVRSSNKKNNFLTLPFLDVLVEKNDHEFVTSIYKKPTFTGQYIRWNSFCPMKRKTDMISTLVPWSSSHLFEIYFST